MDIDTYKKETEKLNLYLKKERILKEIKQDGLIFVAELDIFRHPKMEELIVEFEFFNEKQAEKFKIPKWCLKEVTNDKEYRNINIAKRLKKYR